ncbi:hypothetical protein [Microvirga flavescens]|uniref:hypothetical protein n=1 Tax=Microvirga flavescens TaxID=2249811 RepID=UPI000DD53717|nr:hypothetical protein [Microvirga flavescens]
MATRANASAQNVPLGVGYYTVPEAARLLKVPGRNINRWLGGYAYKGGRMPPLWTPELPTFDDHLELGFRDLIELRFVNAFIEAGLGLKTIRHCLDYARECVKDERPFSTRRFKTDGRTVFLDSLLTTGETELLDLKQRQYVFKVTIERTFKDLDIEDDAVTRWRPFNGKDTVVIDPQRSFGQPIVADYGVPTVVLADAVEAEGSVDRVAHLYEVPVGVVRDAMRFEEYLRAA